MNYTTGYIVFGLMIILGIISYTIVSKPLSSLLSSPEQKKKDS